MKSLKMLTFLMLAVCCVYGKEFFLVKDGQPCAQIILSPTVTLQESYAADELSGYIEKVTGARLPVGLSPRQGLYAIHLTSSYDYLPKKIGDKRYLLKDDGYMIAATEEGLYITSRDSFGVLYGVYALLKKHFGLRWLYPGEDGESYFPMSSVSIPEGITFSNPSFPGRKFFLSGCGPGPKMALTVQWMLRNNMKPFNGFMNTEHPWGGHDFWTYLPAELFKTRPELFPMRNGKRYPSSWKLDTPGYTNPCVSNPETLKIMSRNLLRTLAQHREVNVFHILQNDTMYWCECEKCRALDSPQERLNHTVSNRFWIYANYMINAVKTEMPSMKVVVHVYINAEDPPDRVKPDPRMDELLLSTMRRCYTHSLGDESCPVNKKYRERIKNWLALGCKISISECTPMLPQGCQIYNPTEGVFARDLKFYRSLGIVGYSDERPPILENPRKHFIRSYYPILASSWYYDNLPRYVQASFLWNADGDFNAVVEDFGSRYYGTAWKYMKQYKTLLRKGYENSGTHFAYGSPNINVGMCIPDVKTLNTLKQHLTDALMETAGNPVTEARVRRDIEAFQGWEMRFHEFADFKDLFAEAHRISTAEPTENDWRKIKPETDFRKRRTSKAKIGTAVRILYNSEKLFLRIQAEEPSPKLMVTTKKNQDEKIWEDNDIELFIAPPELQRRYLHVIFNAAGVRFDALTLHATDSDIAWDSKAVIRTKILGNCWTADVAIPFSAIGSIPKPGSEWKVNIARSRRLTDGTSDSSSWSNGEFHGYDSYRTLKFK